MLDKQRRAEPQATASFRHVAVTSRGVWRIPHLAQFLPEAGQLHFERRPGSSADAVVGWGDRPSARYARAIAGRLHIPCIALEDGFLRSAGLGQTGAPPVSLIVDRSGIYYDARRPSDLEQLVELDGWNSDALLAHAREAIAVKNKCGLSKYNFAPALDLPPRHTQRVLVIDQTKGDASIAGALADETAFARMLVAARDEHPNAEILVKRHPAVAAGLKQGCVDPAAVAGTRTLDRACDPIRLLQQVDAVYTVSSLAGFEALLLGLPVRCFGLPFYGGWGATTDEMTSARRTKRRSAEELFAAAYLIYARYVDPLTGSACTALEAMERLAAFKAHALLTRGNNACYGFSAWKRQMARDVLEGGGGRVVFRRSAGAARSWAKHEKGRAVVWASKITSSPEKSAVLDGVPRLAMEDGFLRSSGLGSDFHPASSVVLDDQGIYYDPRTPNRLETILSETVFDETLIRRAAALREMIVRNRLTKYNLEAAAGDLFAGSAKRRRILVLGQVENDASILCGCEDVRSNLALLQNVRRKRPGAFILFKEHPDVAAGNRPGRIAPQLAEQSADALTSAGDVVSCIEAADEIHTMTSLAGFEALMRGKSVHVYGRPFFAGWRLTEDELIFPRRSRALTLDELVAGTLILYPIYLDPVSRLPCSPEYYVDALARLQRAATKNTGRRRGFGNTLRRMARVSALSVLPRRPVRY